MFANVDVLTWVVDALLTFGLFLAGVVAAYLLAGGTL